MPLDKLQIQTQTPPWVVLGDLEGAEGQRSQAEFSIPGIPCVFLAIVRTRRDFANQAAAFVAFLKGVVSYTGCGWNRGRYTGYGRLPSSVVALRKQPRPN